MTLLLVVGVGSRSDRCLQDKLDLPEADGDGSSRGETFND